MSTDRNRTLRDLDQVHQEVMRLLVWVANARPGAELRITKRNGKLALRKVQAEETVKLDT